MRIGITEPTTGDTPTGNRRQALQWADYLSDAGHEVALDGAPQSDVLVAFNAAKSHESIAAFRAASPDRPIIVVLTGTDIYPEPSADTLRSLAIADRIVALQRRATGQVPPAFQKKLVVVLQAADASPAVARSDDPFHVVVVSHLREIKDPLRAAFAARRLPPDSRIRVQLIGEVLEAEFTKRVRDEAAGNPRFEWLGARDEAAVARHIAGAQLVVVSSYFEGGARVIGEAVVAGTPPIAARNDASCSLLGDDYPGLYEAGNTDELAAHLRRAESDAGFLEGLRRWIEPLAPQFDPRREREAVAALLGELTPDRRDHDGRESRGAASGP